MARKSIDDIRLIVSRLVREVGSRCPFKIAKHLGIVVHFAELGVADGYWIEEKRIKGVLLNEDLSLERQSLVCAHEIGHAIMHTDINSSFMRAYTRLSTNRYEVEANFFAFELTFCGLDEDDTIDSVISRYDLKKAEIKLMYEFLEGQRALGDYETW